MLVKFKLFLNGERNRNTYRNILISFFIKGCSACVSFASVPLLLHYLDKEKYGIWITLITMSNWIGLIDLGLGNGLKNRFSGAINTGNFKLAKEYVSTSYLLITIISLGTFGVFLLGNHFINWSDVLNTTQGIKEEIGNVAIIFFLFFSLRMILQLIQTLLIADQNIFKANLINFISEIIIFLLLFIIVFLNLYKGSLILISLVQASVPVIILLIANGIYFKTKFKKVKPALTSFSRKAVKTLFSLGIQFFLVQVNALILFQSSNFIISNVIGPSAVTTYNIIFKYCSIIAIPFGIILAPFWPAVAEATVKNDFGWIRKSLRSLQLVFIIFLVAGVGLYVISDEVFEIWLGKEISIQEGMLSLMFIYTFFSIWKNIYSYILNGMNLVRVQTLLSTVLVIIFIPLAIFLGKEYGLTGILIANVLVGAPGVFIYPFILSKKLQ